PKPTLIACNVAESDLSVVGGIGGPGRGNSEPPPAGVADPDYSSLRHVQAVQDYARNHFATEAVIISAQIESELVDLSEAEAQEYLRDLGVEGSGVSALIRAVYHLLG